MSARPDFLRAELAELDRLLGELNGDDELTKLGLEARRVEVAAELGDTRADRRIARAALMFDGAPVHASRGIDAEFAGEALERFQKLVAKASAARSGRTLGTRGPIPQSEQAKLLVTGTAPGSFGFVLEEPDGEMFEPTSLGETIADTIALIESTKDDDAFGDVVAETDPEVIAALSKFLELLATNGATMRLRTESAETVLRDADEVRAATGRTSNVRAEADQPIRGTLEGVLPHARRFEFRREGDGEVLIGHIARDLAEPEKLKQFLDLTCVAHMRVVTFQRPGKEHRRYVLQRVEAPKTAPKGKQRRS